MPVQDLTDKVDAIRAALAQTHADPKGLHDAVRDVIETMERHHEIVPADLREAIEALQAEVLDEFYDNLPV